jgi:hypothetical protein
MTTTDTPSTSWAGWYRESRRVKWRLVVRGDSEAEVLDALLLHTPPGDKLTLPSGRDPNKERRR